MKNRTLNILIFLIFSLFVVGCDDTEDLCAEVNCGSHGSCVEGTCQCDQGYTGAQCSECADGYTADGDECIEDTTDCGTHGTFNDETENCDCELGYTGTHCDECDDGYMPDGDDCIEIPDCGDHGTYDVSAEQCDCDTGWAGNQCDNCDDGYIMDGDECVEGECLDNPGCDDGNPCNGEETCNENRECVDGTAIVCVDNATCNEETAECECDEGYEWLEATDECLREVLADFDDLSLDADSFWNGADESGYFECGEAIFYNYHNTMYSSWDGFAYSNMTDIETPGYENQHSAITGGGTEDSANYGVAYFSTFSVLGPPTVEFTAPTRVAGFFVTNTTYAFLSMQDGDSFAKQFGGETGEDPDWYLLTIHAMSRDGKETGTVEFYLADFRFENADEDYILDDWTWVDLTSLGEVSILQFTLSSSDNGKFGMNTPAYFAIDEILRYGR